MQNVRSPGASAVTEATASAAATSAPALKRDRGALARGLEGDAHLVVGATRSASSAS